jgi:hypothetical protein
VHLPDWFWYYKVPLTPEQRTTVEDSLQKQWFREDITQFFTTTRITRATKFSKHIQNISEPIQ